ncbi:MAG TPA: hypothetical protein PKA63_02075 [Oligoflexia bacterium]|nr:hypothetical protein [Oligoflexia bacterium]HMP47438.1 hypothetical protein [Oligoflexia bacterium]
MKLTDAGLEEDIVREFGGLVNFPNLSLYVKKYANSLGGNDQKAIKAYKFYETYDRLRALELELLAVKNEKASLHILRVILGDKREHQFGTWAEWAKRMLLWKNSEGV